MERLSQEPIQQPEQSQDKRLFRISFFAAFLVILLLFVLNSFVYLLRVTFYNQGYVEALKARQLVIEKKDETSSWQTYRNEKYKFEVKYPENWNFKNITENTKKGLQEVLLDIRLIEDESSTAIWPASFTIVIYSNSQNLSFENWIKKHGPEDPTGGSLVNEMEDIVFNGFPAKDLTIFGFDHYTGEILIAKNGNLYQLVFEKVNPNDPDFNEHKIIYNQILSTFKFIPSTNSEQDEPAKNMLHQDCSENNYCSPGQTCVSYFGIAGASGPEFKTCEIPCTKNAGCPSDLQCVTVADGPGQVCYEVY